MRPWQTSGSWQYEISPDADNWEMRETHANKRGYVKCLNTSIIKRWQSRW